MAFDLKARAIKALLPMITDFLPILDPAIADYRNAWAEKHKVEEGEEIVCILFQVENKTHISIVIMTKDNAVRSQLETMPFDKFVLSLIDTFKKQS